VAAELWSIPLADVLERIRTGKIPSKTDLGFVLVDAMPGGPKVRKIREPGTPPRTFVEMEVDDALEAAVPPCDDPEPAVVLESFDWRRRAAVGRTRRGPGQLQMAA
jgi:hypothetical protein